MAALAGAVVLALLTAACQVDVGVDIDVAENGSGTVSLGVSLDRAAEEALGELVSQISLGDLAAAGWEVRGFEREADNRVWLRASKPFGNAEQLPAVLEELAGPGTFADFGLQRRSEFARQTWELSGRADPAAALPELLDNFSLNPGLTERIAAAVAAAGGTGLTDGLTLRLSIDMPGELQSGVGDLTWGDLSADQPPAPTSLLLVSESENTTARTLRWVGLAAAGLFVLAVVLNLVGWWYVRRNRRQNARALLDAAGTEPTPAVADTEDWATEDGSSDPPTASWPTVPAAGAAETAATAPGPAVGTSATPAATWADDPTGTAGSTPVAPWVPESTGAEAPAGTAGLPSVSWAADPEGAAGAEPAGTWVHDPATGDAWATGQTAAATTPGAPHDPVAGATWATGQTPAAPAGTPADPSEYDDLAGVADATYDDLSSVELADATVSTGDWTASNPAVPDPATEQTPVVDTLSAADDEWPTSTPAAHGAAVGDPAAEPTPVVDTPPADDDDWTAEQAADWGAPPADTPQQPGTQPPTQPADAEGDWTPEQAADWGETPPIEPTGRFADLVTPAAGDYSPAEVGEPAPDQISPEAQPEAPAEDGPPLPEPAPSASDWGTAASVTPDDLADEPAEPPPDPDTEVAPAATPDSAPETDPAPTPQPDRQPEPEPSAPHPEPDRQPEPEPIALQPEPAVASAPAAPGTAQPAGRGLKLAVISAWGVLFQPADPMSEILIPFLRQSGSAATDGEIREAFRLASLGRISTGRLWEGCGLAGEPNWSHGPYAGRMSVSPGAADFIRSLLRNGVGVACVTNDVADWSWRLRQWTGFEEITPWVVSSDIGIRLPDPGVFEMLRRAADVPFAECLVIARDHHTLDAARSLGMSTALFGTTPGAQPPGAAHPAIGDFQTLLRQPPA